ncbi:hypothetical protein Tco_1069788 [Tanacetum coccineum]|uniref:Uncharacterized protein n=1 Tax=Tanacetum coccineum TaxID=301880 RepID=A0ABQ5HJM8_9ASTR
MAGKGCALHHWVHDVVFIVSIQLVDSDSIFGSIVPLVKPLDIRKLESSSSRLLELAVNPYKSFSQSFIIILQLVLSIVPRLLVCRNDVVLLNAMIHADSAIASLMFYFHEHVLMDDLWSIDFPTSLEYVTNATKMHAVVTASAQNDRGILEAGKSTRFELASQECQFRLSTSRSV